jgi:hypothetical protein
VLAFSAIPSGSGGKSALVLTENVYGGVPPLAAIVHPVYADPCVPPGHDEVVIVRGPPPPLVVTVTLAVFVLEPAAFVAVSVYIVVAVGLTLVDPLADADVKLPGVIAMLVAPLVDQLSVLLAPELMLVGLALNELIVGACCAFTVTVAVDVADPFAFVAVSVYIVVAVGLTFVDPLADADVKLPGVIAMLVASLVDQLSVLLAPELIVAGLAANDPMVGFCPGGGFPPPLLVPPQFAATTHANSITATAPKFRPRSRVFVRARPLAVP